ncbi:MAG: hypothetical protein LBF60_06950 [Treponema sp.]|jgi:hypothetical protein|nr:hypothetical protein [Treponema sp.]
MFEECREFEDKRPLIVCKEKRTEITFYNGSKETVAKISIDGCVITDNTVKKCDYLLLCVKIKKAVFVEMKGNKVETAIKQLSATLDNEMVKTPLAQYEKKAYAVVTGNPVFSRFQNAQDRFFRKHKGCTLRVVKSSHTYDLLSGSSRI